MNCIEPGLLHRTIEGRRIRLAPYSAWEAR